MTITKSTRHLRRMLRPITIGLCFLLLFLTGIYAGAQVEVAVPAHHLPIIAALREGRIRDAYELLEQIETPMPSDLAPLSMGVRLMLDHLYLVDATDLEMPPLREKMDRALALAEQAIAADPVAPDGWGALALALNWAYQSEEALKIVQSARSQYPQHAGLMVVEAEVRAQLTDYATASGLITLAINLIGAESGAAMVARAYYVAGNIAQILGQQEASIEAYEAAWRISRQPYDESRPWNVVPPGYILYQLGPIYLFAGRGQEALDAYTQALTIDRQDAFLYYLRGRIHRFDGRFPAAEHEFRLCLTVEVDQLRCKRNLGQLAFEQNQWLAVIDWFNPVISAQSQISDDYYYLAAAYVQVGECDRALPVWERGLVLRENATGNPHWDVPAFEALQVHCS